MMQIQSLSYVITGMQGWDPCPLMSSGGRFWFTQGPLLRFCQLRRKRATHSGGPLCDNPVARIIWDTHPSPLHTRIHQLQLYSGETASGYSLKVRGVCISRSLLSVKMQTLVPFFFFQVYKKYCSLRMNMHKKEVELKHFIEDQNK